MSDDQRVQCRCGEFYDLGEGVCPACGTVPRRLRDAAPGPGLDQTRHLRDAIVAERAETERLLQAWRTLSGAVVRVGGNGSLARIYVDQAAWDAAAAVFDSRGEEE